MKRQPWRSRRRIKTHLRAGAALALALILLGLGYYRGVAAQKEVSPELRVEVELLPGESVKVIDVTNRPFVPVAIYGSVSVDAAALEAASVAVAGAPPTKQARGRLRAELKDLNGDGRVDLLVTVAAISLRVRDGDNFVTVTAATRDGRRVSGTAKARVVHARQFAAAAAPQSSGTVFSNSAPITINDGASPPTSATPYPSTVNVSGLVGNVVNLTVTLTGLSHTFPADVDVLLVGPTGADALLISDVGGSTPASNVTLTLDDSAADSLPDNGPLVSGTFKPTNVGAGDDFPAPAPMPTGNTVLSTFNGTNPNGAWKLYVVDDNSGNAGTIAGGWSLTINTTAHTCNTANIDINDSNSPPTTASVYPSQINVSGLTGNVLKVTVELKNLTHTFSDDIDMLLVGPTGATAVIMSDAGGSWPIFNLDLTFDDSAQTALPDEGQIISGTYKPGNYDIAPDSWPGVPTPSASSALSAFIGTNPNGIWKLYIVDDEAGDSGNLGGGWCLNITTGDPTLARLSSQSAAVSPSGRVAVEWNASYEIDNLGFNVYRDAGGERVRVNREIIAGSALFAGQGVGLATGRTYRCFDQLPAGVRDVRYWIEAVGLDGSSDWHGPVTPIAAAGVSDDTSSPSLEDLGERQSDGPKNNNVTKLTIPIVPPTGQKTTALKLYVQQTGVYRVTQAELLAAGLSPSVDPRMLQLYEDGRERPILVPGEADGRFDAGDAVEFYATAPDNPYTTSHVYWLIAGSQPGQRIKQARSKGVAPGATSFLATAELRERNVYFAVLRNGERENFFGATVGGNGVTRSLRLSSVVTSAATLEVTMQGLTLSPHRVHLLLNDEAVGDLTFEGQRPAALRVSLPPALLREGDNAVQLIAEGGSTDISLIDTIRLHYWRGYRADGDALACTAQAAQAVTLGGFSSPGVRVMDVTEAEKGGAQEVAAVVRRDQSGYSATVSVPGEGARQLLAFTVAEMRRPAAIVADIASSWRQPANAADLVIITRREMMPAFAPLAALRQQQGLRVALVDVEDLYDEFSFGNKTPQAIKDFLAYAATSWQGGPRFVLMGGDASYDAKNYLGLGDTDVVPTKLIDTAELQTASDEWFVDLANDGKAGMAIGRLPARTATEAAAMVAKIVNYDEAARPEGVLLVSDDDSDGVSFEVASNELRGVIESTQRVEQINRGSLDAVAAKGKLLDALNRGHRVVNYYGHGNTSFWRGNLLTSADAAQLTNSDNLSMFVMMTCLNAYFHDPLEESLGESLMRAKGGAIAVWASSGLGDPGSESLMDMEIFRRLLDPSSGLTIGEAALKAKAATHSRDAQRTFILLGDPATRLR
jgi:subtilisin-like proprotein convertase family protein